MVTDIQQTEEADFEVCLYVMDVSWTLKRLYIDYTS